MEASWQGEALVALAWAVGAMPMPPVDATSDPRPIMELVPRPWDAIKSVDERARHRLRVGCGSGKGARRDLALAGDDRAAAA